MTPKLTNHQKRILDYLKNGWSLTNLDAILRLKVGNLKGRIHELRGLGYNVKTRMVSQGGAEHAEYYLPVEFRSNGQMEFVMNGEAR